MEKALSVAQEQKQLLRREMKALRHSLNEADRSEIDRALVERLLNHELTLASRRIALFHPMLEKAEIDLRSLDAALRERGAELYYPFERSSGERVHRGFAKVESLSGLERSSFGYFQPSDSANPALAGQLDLVIVPALAAAADGSRLGYGAGYYDQCLEPFVPPAKTMVVVSDAQLLETLPQEPHDRRMNYVLTNTRSLEVH